MRIHLQLVSLEQSPAIPVNYNHMLSKAILKLIQQAEPEFHNVLRTKGLRGQQSKRFRMFTFSGLRFHGPRWTLEDGLFQFTEPAQAELILSFPYEESFVQSEIVPLLQNATLKMVRHSDGAENRLRIAELAARPLPPAVSGTYRALAPITIARKIKEESRYLSPRHPETAWALTEDLLDKYELLTGERLPQGSISLKIDASYLARGSQPMKVITIHEGTPDEARVRAFLTPIQLHGDPRLIRTALACGIGERNSLGFGILGGMMTKSQQPRLKTMHG